MVDVPVFPGYLFCRFDLCDRYRVLNVPGVAQIVGAGSTPVPIEEDQIRSVRLLVESKTVLVAWPFLRTGQRVRIDRGPFSGVEGIVARAEDGSPRIVVSIDLLQRSVAAEVEREWIGAVLPRTAVA